MGAALVGALACQSEATKRCHDLLQAAQPVVTNVDGTSVDAVQTALDAVEAARAACQEAGRSQEHDELVKAKRQLVGHLEYIKNRPSRNESAELTPEQLEKLVKEGDPDCPKGQAYKHRGSGKEVRCKGPQIADMGWKQADEYWKGRGFKTKVGKSPPTLTAEFGSELYIYEYTRPDDPKPPKCLTLIPAPGVPWMEATARATGAKLRFLKREDGFVRSRRGKLPLVIEDGDKGLAIHIGDCGKTPTPAPSASQ
jgi:hypothetical protein